jgi:hypothetical protein
MERVIERIQKDPDNLWSWYELWKLLGFEQLPKAAKEGYAEYTGKQI